MNFKNFLDVETWRLKFRGKVLIPIASRLLSKRLVVTDFTIISNNCWGGTVYETYDLQKQSPTVGMFIMPSDYLTMISNLQSYLAAPLVFIPPEESKWAAELGGEANWGTYLIGRINDVELHMLHYQDEVVARSKWEARIQRINHNRLIFKFNDQNGATEEHFKAFDALNLDHKILFSVRELPELASAIKISAPSNHQFVRASYEPLIRSRSWNVAEYIQSCFGKSK